jgi:L-ascorbate 6-phosphate lactonase
MDFLNRLKKCKVGEKEIAISWLGQAGFLLKTHKGNIILIDPYLSDYANRVLQKDNGQAFRRMTAPLFDPAEIKADILLCSHEHQDHLDIDALPGLLKNSGIRCYINGPSMAEIKKANLDVKKFTEFKKGQTIQFDEFELLVVDGDHGELAPDAAGFILDFGFIRIYYSGDTSYNKKRLAGAIAKKPEVALLPINGAFGNLNAKEAAQFAKDLNAKLCIPHHFWTFPKHTGTLGNPIDAIELFPVHAPKCNLHLATPGEFLIINDSIKKA